MTINLKWSPRVVGDSQKVYRSESQFDVDSLPSVLATVGAADIDYADTTAAAGVVYYYAVSTVLGSREVLSPLAKVVATGAAAPEPTWTPTELFTAGEKGAWYDPSDLATMWTTSGKTTQVSADGDRVGYMSDLSGNAYHLTTPDLRRPTYRTDGTRHWLEFDGVDNQLGHTHNQTIADFIVCSSCREETRQNGTLYSLGRSAVDPHRLKAMTPWGDGNYYFDTYWSSTGRITGAWSKSVDDDAVISHARTGSAVTTFESGSSLGTVSVSDAITGTTVIYLGSFGGQDYYQGRMYGFCAVFGANSTQDQSDLETYMAGKAGITL